MISKTFLSIVIPAYNEESRIVRALAPTLDYLDKADFASEIVVVSDGSKDKTLDAARACGKNRKTPVRTLEYFPNMGKGHAVRYGMVRASGERILFMDADYAVPIEDIEKAFEGINKGFDIAIGSRGVAGASVNAFQSLPRRLSARLYTLIQNLYLGFNYPDTQCGFKMFTSKAAQTLFSQQKLNSVIFDAEILWLAKKQGFSVTQFPVTWTHVADSRIQYDSLRKSLFVFQELFRIRGLHSS
ncbi:MAG: glycosyltransferase family 2 protein [Desulfatibacillaceae bacterium]|nr:glycosyltransferase family 2 protein [Desulfatibacillaceae bacterium]